MVGLGPMRGLGLTFAGLAAFLPPAAALPLPLPVVDGPAALSTALSAGDALTEPAVLLRPPLAVEGREDDAEGGSGAMKVSFVIPSASEDTLSSETGMKPASGCGRSAGLLLSDESADSSPLRPWPCGPPEEDVTGPRPGESDDRAFMSKSEEKFMKLAGVTGLYELGGGGGPIGSSWYSACGFCCGAKMAEVGAEVPSISVKGGAAEKPSATWCIDWYCCASCDGAGCDGPAVERSTGLGVSILPTLPLPAEVEPPAVGGTVCSPGDVLLDPEVVEKTLEARPLV